MYLSEIQKLALNHSENKCVYHIPDGVHECVLKFVEYKSNKDRVYLTFEMNDGVRFRCSESLAKYGKEPFLSIIEPFTDDTGFFEFDDIEDYSVIIRTKTNDARDGTKFSNIIDFSYVVAEETEGEDSEEDYLEPEDDD